MASVLVGKLKSSGVCAMATINRYEDTEARQLRRRLERVMCAASKGGRFPKDFPVYDQLPGAVLQSWAPPTMPKSLNAADAGSSSSFLPTRRGLAAGRQPTYKLSGKNVVCPNRGRAFRGSAWPLENSVHI